MSNFTIHLNKESGHKEVGVVFTTFSDGAETCKIEGAEHLGVVSHTVIDFKLEDVTRDLVRLMLVKDAVDRLIASRSLETKTLSLCLPYMPNARADRVFSAGMPHPLVVFANVINGMNYDTVYIDDPHSDVTTALLNNVVVCSQQEMVGANLRDIQNVMGDDFTICAPDLGAAKKVFDVVTHLQHKNYIQGIKIRDVSTGNIVKCDVIEETVPENVLIVDDISDGGASFKFLAKKLRERGAKKVGLFVSHGIFSKGLDAIKGDIDCVFIGNIVGNYINYSDVAKFNKGN